MHINLFRDITAVNYFIGTRLCPFLPANRIVFAPATLVLAARRVQLARARVLYRLAEAVVGDSSDRLFHRTAPGRSIDRSIDRPGLSAASSAYLAGRRRRKGLSCRISSRNLRLPHDTRLVYLAARGQG